MSTPVEIIALRDPPDVAAGRLRVMLASGSADVRAAQRLRHRVFVEEMGAHLDGGVPGIESDRFDPYCEHLLVRDEDHGRVVGCYRILTDLAAGRAGGFYSQTEFDLTRVLALPGRRMEVGRTCVHPDYRGGAVIALLWQGLARYMLRNGFEYLMGCASIPLRSGTDEALAIYERLRARYLAPESWRVFPRAPMPRLNLTGHAVARAAIPSLIKAYLQAGARVCGDPAWDPQFNVADLFIQLRASDVSARHARHFMARAA